MYSKLAGIGDRIKAFDFEPLEGREDRYIIGTVSDKEDYAYEVIVEEDTLAGPGERIEVKVPFNLGCFDYEGRVSKIS